MMRHTVKMHGIVIGHSELERRDATERRAAGRFRPGLGYELVQPIFQLFSEAVPVRGGPPADEAKLARYHAARDRLGLVLVDASGREIQTSAIHIEDYEGGEVEVEVLVGDERFWR